MFMYELSTRAWWSVLGSHTITRRGSKNLYIKYKNWRKKVLLGVLVSEGSWGPFASQVVGLGIGGELKDGSLGVLSVGNDL
jgi:hypothetical protein